MQPPPPAFDGIPTAEHDRQISAWLQGLLTIAWADGHYDPEEQVIITSITETELESDLGLRPNSCISPNQLASTLGGDRQLAENFLRTAVMVAIADGVYSSAEDDVLHQFCAVLNLPDTLLSSLRTTLNCGAGLTPTTGEVTSLSPLVAPHHESFAVLNPMREWLDHLDIHDPRLARFLCKMIPPQCPFERDVVLFGHKLVHIPPMCKVNPLYEQLMGLRFRALSYLADDCQEDVSKYC